MRERRASNAQLAASRVAGSHESISVLKRAARKEHGLWSRDRRALKNQLFDLYIASVVTPEMVAGDDRPSGKFVKEPTRAYEIFHSDSVTQKLEQIKTDIPERASKLGVLRRSKIAAKTILLTNRLSEDRSKELLQAAGYPNAESKLIGEKLKFSGALDAVTTAGALVIVSGGVLAETLSQAVPHVTRGDLIASEAALYLTTGVVAWTNKKLMDSPAVKTTANVLATAGYYFSPKLLSEKGKKAMEWIGVTVGTAIPVVLGDAAGWTAIRSLAGAQGTLGRTMASIGIEAATALGNVGWLVYKNRQAGKSQIEQ